jgi:hypothetical protein
MVKKTIRLILIRLFGYDPYLQPKGIKPNKTIHHIEVPDDYGDFNQWAKQIFNEKSKV